MNICLIQTNSENEQDNLVFYGQLINGYDLLKTY